MDNFTDAFMMKLAPLGASAIYSTFFGGDTWEESNAMAVDAAGNAVVVGPTSSNDLPIIGEPVQDAIDGICIVGSNERYCYDAFAATFGPTGALTWSSYLGGTFDDMAYAVAVDAGGSIYVAGRAESGGFPTTAGAPAAQGLRRRRLCGEDRRRSPAAGQLGKSDLPAVDPSVVRFQQLRVACTIDTQLAMCRSYCDTRSIISNLQWHNSFRHKT
jgi:hypothetical protein